MLTLVTTVLLACSSSVLGLDPLHTQQTHAMQPSSSISSSSSWGSVCSSTRGLSSAAAARIAASLAEDPRIRISAVKLTGSCDTLRLLPTAHAGSSSGMDSSAQQGPAVLLLSNSLAAQPGGSTADIAAEADRLHAAETAPGAADAAPHGPSAQQAAAAAAQEPVLLHIDFSVAKNASFFSDLVIRYSMTEQWGQHSRATTPSVWIEPAGGSSAGGRQVLLGPDSAAGQHKAEALAQQHTEAQLQGAGSSSGSSRVLRTWQDVELSTLIGLVPALNQVSSGCAACEHRPALAHVTCSRLACCQAQCQASEAADGFSL